MYYELIFLPLDRRRQSLVCNLVLALPAWIGPCSGIMRLPNIAVFPLALLCLVLAGCGFSADPYQTPLSTATPADYASAASRLALRLSPEQMQEFEDCVGAFRTRIILDKTASGTDAVHALACRQIDGLTPYQVLLRGYELKIAQYAGDIAAHQGNLDKLTRGHLALGRPEPSLKASVYYTDLVEHIAKLNHSLEKTRERLAELQKTPPVAAGS